MAEEGSWTPRWAFRKGLGLVPYCTLHGGPANLCHLPDEGEILAPADELERLEAERDELLAEKRIGAEADIAVRTFRAAEQASK